MDTLQPLWMVRAAKRQRDGVPLRSGGKRRPGHRDAERHHPPAGAAVRGVGIQRQEKPVHAIVRVDAPDYAEYRRRVDYLYSVCQKNGLVLDQACRNPSRLSRMPGAMRGEQKTIFAGNQFRQGELGRVEGLGGICYG